VKHLCTLSPIPFSLPRSGAPANTFLDQKPQQNELAAVTRRTPLPDADPANPLRRIGKRFGYSTSSPSLPSSSAHCSPLHHRRWSHEPHHCSLPVPELPAGDPDPCPSEKFPPTPFSTIRFKS
jgi:hypothetical protein